MSAQISSWKAKEAEAQKKIDAKRRELEALKVSFDMSYISKLAKDEASHQQSVKNLNTWKPHLIETRKRRADALRERWAARDRVAMLRETFGRQATTTLREALSDLQVSLKYARNAYSPDAADLIIQVMGWKTNQQTRASWLVEKLTIPVLLEAIQRKDLAPILALKTPEKVDVFKRDEAQTIVERLAEPSVRFALERTTLHDLPRLQCRGRFQMEGVAHDISSAISRSCHLANSNPCCSRSYCHQIATGRSSSINLKTI